MTTFEELLSPAQPILENIERQRHRHGLERFTWLDFVRVLVYYFTVRPGSLRSLVTRLETADSALELPVVKRSTLSDAFMRFPASLMRQAWQETLRRVQLPEIPELALIGSVHVADGSELPIMGGIFWDHVSKEISRFKLHLDLRLNDMLPVEFLLSAAKGGERQALRQILRPGVLYVLDRGYFSFAFCKEMLLAEADFVMRIYNNIAPREILETLPVSLPSELSGVYQDLQDRKVRFANKAVSDRPLRLVTFRLGDVRYALLTNRFDLTTFQVILLYAYRWQVELMFRYIKHVLSNAEPITLTPNGLANYFAAMFLTTLLHMHLQKKSLEAEGHLPPPLEDEDAWLAEKATPSHSRERPSSQAKVAHFLAGIGQRLLLYWRITKHWLEVLASVLHRPFDEKVISLLNKYAFAT